MNKIRQAIEMGGGKANTSARFALEAIDEAFGPREREAKTQKRTA